MKPLPIKINHDQEKNAFDETLLSGRRIASVVLNYNSTDDLLISVPQLALQKDVEHIIIIVDNSSRTESVKQIRTWLANWQPEAVLGTHAEVDAWVTSHPKEACESGRVYFIMHHENRGYSAGNNIGIRLAEKLNADAVLIANPDMRFGDNNYLSSLSNTLFRHPKCFVAASRILGADGKDQNPQRESTYLEELFWPYLKLRYRLTKKSLVITSPDRRPRAVEKVSGCCLLISMQFLKKCNHLDENVFLYCEEPILTARTRLAGGTIIYDPGITAIHAHDTTKKGSGTNAALCFIRSRKYYINKYSSYSILQKKLLFISYSTMAQYYKFRHWVEAQ